MSTWQIVVATRAQRFIERAQEAVEAGEVVFDAEHFGPAVAWLFGG